MLGGDPRIIKYREATQQRFPRPFKVSDVENSKAIGSGVKQQHLQPPDARGRGALGDLYPTTGGSGHSSIVGDLAWELPSIAPAPSADTSTWSSGGGAAPPSFPHATSSTIISSPYGPGMIAGEGVSLATTPGALASSFIPSYAPGTPDIYSSPAAMWRETSSPPRCAANPPSLPVGLLLSDLPGRSSGSSDGSRELLPDITDTDVSDAGPSSPHTHRQQQPATSGDGWGTVMDHDPRDRSASSSPKLDDDEGLLRLAIGHAAAHGRCHPPTLNAHAGSTRAGTTYSAGGGGASSRGAWSGANTVEEAWGIVDVLQGQVWMYFLAESGCPQSCAPSLPASACWCGVALLPTHHTDVWNADGRSWTCSGSCTRPVCSSARPASIMRGRSIRLGRSLCPPQLQCICLQLAREGGTARRARGRGTGRTRRGPRGWKETWTC